MSGVGAFVQGANVLHSLSTCLSPLSASLHNPSTWLSLTRGAFVRGGIITCGGGGFVQGLMTYLPSLPAFLAASVIKIVSSASDGQQLTSQAVTVGSVIPAAAVQIFRALPFVFPTSPLPPHFQLPLGQLTQMTLPDC